MARHDESQEIRFFEKIGFLVILPFDKGKGGFFFHLNKMASLLLFNHYSFPEKCFGLESKIYLGSSKLKFGLQPKSLSEIL
jgi:hypothetical protein